MDYNKLQILYGKCKRKYKSLKNKLDIYNFFDRANKTVLENLYDILFNMYLVKNNARPAFLLEFANFSFVEIKNDDFLELIKSIYDEFTYTIEHTVEEKIDGKIHTVPYRVFIHIKSLTEYDDRDPNKDHDIWVAENLGFNCYGLPSIDIDRVAIHYYLIEHDNSHDFYTEICSKKDYDMSIAKFNKKRHLFNNFAMRKDWTVKMETSIIRANPEDFLINLLITDKLTHEYVDEVMDYMYLIGTPEHVSLYNFDELLQNKKLLLFLLLFSKSDPFVYYYPLTKKESKEKSKAVADAILKASVDKENGTDPIKMYTIGNGIIYFMYITVHKLILLYIN